MKYLIQLGIILSVTFIAEILKHIIPLPVPASIYGLLLMLTALKTGIVPIDKVKDAGMFLIEIMPMMFIPAAVGIMASFADFAAILVPALVVVIATTFIVMGVTGRTAQAMLKGGGRR